MFDSTFKVQGYLRLYPRLLTVNVAHEDAMKHATTLIYAVALFIGFASSNSTLAQQASIKGTVIDQSTQEPIEGVNVFISNSLLGDASNGEGEFVIERVPMGNVLVVASVIGYEPYTEKLRITNDEPVTLAIMLKPRIYQPGSVEVSAERIKEETTTFRPERPEERDKNLVAFENFFLGVSPNADKCEITNPDALRFEINDEDEVLRATADDALVIDNFALGYQIYFVLNSFEVSVKTNARAIKYNGSIGFSELEPRTKREGRRWKRARRDAYRGSVRHFLTSLVSNSLMDEGYLLIDESKLQIQEPSGTPGARPSDRIPSVSAKDILEPGSIPSERILNFDGYLKVVNMNDAPNNQFTDFKQYAADWQVPDSDPMYQISWLALTDGPTVITADGRVNNAYGLTKLGYWFFERVAEMLPLEYQP